MRISGGSDASRGTSELEAEDDGPGSRARDQQCDLAQCCREDTYLQQSRHCLTLLRSLPLFS